MNSFYGQMRWGEKFEQFFYEYRITNHPFSEENAFNLDPEKDELLETLKKDEEVFIQPNEDFAIFNINTSNHWIGIIPIDSKGDDKPKNTQAGFSLFHQAPDLKDTSTIPTILQVNKEDLEVSLDQVESLKSGDILQIINGKYDRAGHFTGIDDAEKAYFMLPEQIIRIDNSQDLVLKKNDQKFHFNKDPLDLITLKITGDNDLLTFTHATPFTDKNVPKEMDSIKYICNMDNTHPPIPEGENRLLPTTIRNFEPGDYISTQKLSFDQGGHLIGYENIYYRLPYSEVDERLDAIDVSIADLQTEMTGVKKEISDLDSAIDELNKRIFRIGNDDQFDTLRDSILASTSEDMLENGSLAYALYLVSEKVRKLMNIDTSILNNIKMIGLFLDGKYSDFNWE